MSRQLITFQIGEQSLGMDIMAIREIRAWTPTTPLPCSPVHIHGVVNLRGTVLPVIDLAARLGWGKCEPSQRHVIIVVRVEEKLQGMIVDAVHDIVTLGEEPLQPPPDAAVNNAANYIEGITEVDGRMILVVALDRIAAGDVEPLLADAA